MSGAHICQTPADPALRECDPLVEVLAALSPAGSTIRCGSRGESAPAGTINELEMVSVRSTLLPARSLPAAGVVLARARVLGLSRRERALRVAAAVGLASGGGLAFTRRRVFLDMPRNRPSQSDAKTIDDLISDVLGRRVYCGLAQTRDYRSNRKALLTVADRFGRVRAYCKVASNALTIELVAREAETLRALGAHRFEHLTLPSLLWTGDVGLLRLLLVSALKPPLIARAEPDHVLRAMTELALSSPSPQTALAESSWWASLNVAIGASPPGEVHDGLSESARLLGNAFGNDRIGFGRWHGDWTRWNTAVTPTGVLAWDLERSEELAPIGFDAVHRRLIALVDSPPGTGTPADTATIRAALTRSSREPCSVDGVQPASSAAVTWAWLLTVVLRAVEDARVLPSPWAERRALRLAKLALVSASSEDFIR